MCCACLHVPLQRINTVVLLNTILNTPGAKKHHKHPKEKEKEKKKKIKEKSLQLITNRPLCCACSNVPLQRINTVVLLNTILNTPGAKKHHKHPKEKKRKEKGRKGKERKKRNGKERKGKERKEKERKGKERKETRRKQKKKAYNFITNKPMCCACLHVPLQRINTVVLLNTILNTPGAQKHHKHQKEKEKEKEKSLQLHHQQTTVLCLFECTTASYKYRGHVKYHTKHTRS